MEPSQKKVLFTIAAFVEDRPGRWTHTGKAYAQLAAGLRKMGCQTFFYVHPEAVHRQVKRQPHTVSSQVELVEMLRSTKPDVVFVWGGRIDADRQTVLVVREFDPDIQIVFSELGWFPQRDRIYFDPEGTNAEASFSSDRSFEEATEQEKAHFLRMRRAILRKDLGLSFYQGVAPFEIMPPDPTKPILVPLQDERDTNIIESSPFKKMREFVEFLHETYPSNRFIVRPHPRAPVDDLPELPNIEYQDSKVPLFSCFGDIGMVLGINSTVLLQAAMHNKTVAAVGDGIATCGGCVYKLDPSNPPTELADIRVDSQAAENRLTFLLVKRQLEQRKLSSPGYIRNSNLFRLLA